jgi:hypothetical protein
MKIIINEGQSKEILDLFASLIKQRLSRYDVFVDDIDITPNYFPRGVNVVIKLNDISKVDEAKGIVKSIVAKLITFGKVEISFS